jgi:hypothetical protein
MMFSVNSFRFVLVLAAACNAVTSAQTAVVNLGTAGNYVILAKTGISTAPTSDITGDIGVSPIAATAITGFSLIMDGGMQYSTSSQLSATSQAHAASYGGPVATTLATAVSDMLAAYSDAAGRDGETAKTNIAAGYLGPVEGSNAKPLEEGVYSFGTDVIIADDSHFSGDENSVFIIRTTGALIQLKNTLVILGPGVNPENIFWQIAGHVVVGAGAHMAGILLVKNDALFTTGSSLQGRVLAQTACNLQSTTIVV